VIDEDRAEEEDDTEVKPINLSKSNQLRQVEKKPVISQL
jgi:hypothetical protein